MEHIIVIKYNEKYFKLRPEEGYMIKEKYRDNLFSDVITDNPKNYEAVKI